MRRVLISYACTLGLLACGAPYQKSSYSPTMQVGLEKKGAEVGASPSLSVKDVEDLTRTEPSSQQTQVAANASDNLQNMSDAQIDAAVSSEFASFDGPQASAAPTNAAPAGGAKGKLAGLLKALKGGNKAKAAQLANEINQDMQAKAAAQPQNAAAAANAAKAAGLLKKVIGGAVKLGLKAVTAPIKALIALLV